MKISLEIPNRSLWSVLGLVIAGIFTYLQFEHFLLPGFREILDDANGMGIEVALRLMWVPIIAYGLVGLNVCLVVNMFKPLKPKGGLIFGLVVGLVVGLIVGLVPGLIIAGLVFGLVVGLVAGLVEEFTL